MTLAQLVQRVLLKLGEQSTFYTVEEIVVNGLNPAQRLLCKTFPKLLQRRFVIDILPDQIFTNLRRVTPQIRMLTRVVVGDVTDDGPPIANVTTGEVAVLQRTTLETLAQNRHWLMDQGQTLYHWQWGEWFGVYPRPMTTLTLTLICDGIPDVFSLDLPDALPNVATVYHPVIADVATGLLLLKEGAPISTRGVTQAAQALQLTQGAAA